MHFNLMHGDALILVTNEIWNNVFQYDPTNVDQLKRKFFNNEYVRPIEPLIMDDAFSLLGIRSKPFLYEKYNTNEAWLFAAGSIFPENLRKLINLQILKLKEIGISHINYSGFSPGYFFPGIDSDKYPELYKTLLSIGFKVVDEAITMEADIGNLKYSVQRDQRVSITDLQHSEVKIFLSMVSENFPADCYMRCQGVISKGSIDQITIAKVDSKIVGYAMYASGDGPFEFAPGERFGCFEVIDRYRSLGIGSKLLSATLIKMKSNGIRHAHFLWTTEKASHIYSRYGFNISRRFKIMSLDI
jgi:mycothiol synthase